MREIFEKRKSEILSTPLGNVLDTNLATKHDMKRGQTIQNNTFRNNAFLAKMRKKRKKKLNLYIVNWLDLAKEIISK